MNCFLFFAATLHRINQRFPVLTYAITWTLLLTITVIIASFCPETAFVSAISPSSAFSRACGGGQGLMIRVPLDAPGEMTCLPAYLFQTSKMDYFVPPVFAAIVVLSSAFVVRSMGLWEEDQ
ncbi:hypothetical protein ACHQM5_010026 [Ranunculus cassubicifolius]